MNDKIEGYNRNDYILLRILCLCGAIVTPVIKFVWSYSIAKDEFFRNHLSVIQCIVFSGLFLLLFAATFIHPFVKKYAYYFVYGLYLMATCGSVYAVEYNNFIMQSVLILLLFPASFTMIVKKMAHLIVYDLGSYFLILIALFTADGPGIPKTFLVFFFLFYYLFNYCFVRIRINTQNKLIRSEQDSRNLAFFDSLTGLPNRYYLNNTLQDIITGVGKKAKENAVLFTDLDGFKKVNDTLGHDNGDILLQQVAERFVKCVRSGDIVSRYGGDEFVILLPGADRTNAHSIAQRILNAFSLPFNIEENDIYITPSIGISLYPKDGEDVASLIKNADSAMYKAKEKGKNNFQYFT
jgi:diguanylate cyclase (GGDEF)-like protein